MDGSCWTVRAWRAEDAQVLARLATAAAEDPERPPRSLADPLTAVPDGAAPHAGLAPVAERVGQVALAPDGRPLACVLGRLERVAVGAEEHAWLRVDHVASAARLPPGLGRGAPLLAALKACASERLGPPPAAPIAFGFPSRRAFRMTRYLLAGEVVRNQNQLVLAPGELAYGPAAGVRVEEATRFPADTDELFARARAAHGAAGPGALRVRDAAAQNRRYGAAPGAPAPSAPGIELARSAAGTLIGYAVQRVGRYEGHEGLLVLDWLTAPDEPAAGHALRARLAERARALGLPRVVMLLPDTVPAWRAFQDANFRVRPTSDFLLARCAQRPWNEDWLYERWYYTLGDFEG